MTEQKHTGLQKAIKRAGGGPKLAALLGISPQTVMRWLREDGVLSLAERTYPANAVSQAVDKAGGAVKVGQALGVTYQAVNEWMRQGYMPADRAQQMEVLFGVPRATLISPRLRNSMGLGGEL